MQNVIPLISQTASLNDDYALETLFIEGDIFELLNSHNLESVRQRIQQHDFDISVIDEQTGNTLLHSAVSLGLLSISEALLKHANHYDLSILNACNHQGYTPLMMAISLPLEERLPLLKMLIDSGCNSAEVVANQAKIAKENVNGWTYSVLDSLIDAGADVIEAMRLLDYGDRTHLNHLAHAALKSCCSRVDLSTQQQLVFVRELMAAGYTTYVQKILNVRVNHYWQAKAIELLIRTGEALTAHGLAGFGRFSKEDETSNFLQFAILKKPENFFTSINCLHSKNCFFPKKEKTDLANIFNKETIEINEEIAIEILLVLFKYTLSQENLKLDDKISEIKRWMVAPYSNKAAAIFVKKSLEDRKYVTVKLMISAEVETAQALLHHTTRYKKSTVQKLLVLGADLGGSILLLNDVMDYAKKINSLELMQDTKTTLRNLIVFSIPYLNFAL